MNKATFRTALAVGLLACTAALAGGGGQNMLLLVNSDNEQALRVANVYARLRAIPDNNILFIDLPTVSGGAQMGALPDPQFREMVIAPIKKHLAEKGLAGQIDYIGFINLPVQTSAFNGAQVVEIATTAALMHMDDFIRYGETPPLTRAISKGSPFYALWGAEDFGTSLRCVRGTRNFEEQNVGVKEVLPNYMGPTYTQGGNTALHHSTVYPDQQDAIRFIQGGTFYMAGAIANTGFFANTPAEVMASFQRAVDADGTKPHGTFYMEANSDIRSLTRDGQFGRTMRELKARGYNAVQEEFTPGFTPKDRKDVMGAVVGSAEYVVPNGSTYLGGAFADSLTSAGALYDGISQTKCNVFIHAGAAGSAGTIMEPSAIAYRFPNAMLHVFYVDGSTLGEAYFKSVATPDLNMFTGDLLAQPFADVPKISLAGAPADGATVSGEVTLQAVAKLPDNAAVATGIRALRLYVDGALKDTVKADDSGAGALSIDTKSLSDGRHELRVVAVNNAAAESEGYICLLVNVNNNGRSVHADSEKLIISPDQIGTINVRAAPGDGEVHRTELRHLGRQLAALEGETAGPTSFSASKLAYGDNRVIPVALFADGSEVAGAPFTVQRNPTVMPGAKPSDPATRKPGILGEYFPNQGGPTIAESCFDGVPEFRVVHRTLHLWSGLKVGDRAQSGIYDPAMGSEVLPTQGIDKLAAKFTAEFTLTPADAGEYQFFTYSTKDSVRVLIDGEVICGYDGNPWNFTPPYVPSVFLAAGEHTLTLLTAKSVSPQQGDRQQMYDIAMYFRGPDGLMRLADDSFFYTTP